MPDKRLPNAISAAIPDDKLSYFLNWRAIDDKSGFFKRFGFKATEPEALKAALLRHAQGQSIIALYETPYGTKYEAQGHLDTPDGRNPVVLVVWIVQSGEDFPTLVTAFPAKVGK